MKIKSILQSSLLFGLFVIGGSLYAMDPKAGEQDLASIIQKEGKEAEVRQLLEAGISPNMQKNGSPILYLAALDRRAGNVKLLLEFGAGPNAQNMYGNTALHTVMGFQNGCMNEQNVCIKIAKALIKQGANINIQNNNYETPLHRACNKGWLRGVFLLVEKGASLSVQNAYGQTPLYTLMSAVNIVSNDFLYVVSQFLRHGAHINTPADDGTSILYVLENKKKSVPTPSNNRTLVQLGREPVQMRVPQFTENLSMFKAFSHMRKNFRIQLYKTLEMLRMRPSRSEQAESALVLSQEVQDDHGGFGLLPPEILNIILLYAMEHDANYIEHDELTPMQRKLLAMKSDFDAFVA